MKKLFFIVAALWISGSAQCQYWELNLGGTGEQWGYEMIETWDKGFVVLAVDGAQLGRIRLIKTDINGNVLWTKHIGIASDMLQPLSIQQTFDGGYIISGRETKYDNSGNSCVIKLNECAEPEWVRILGINGSFDLADKVVQAPDSGYAVLARYVGSHNVTLFKLDKHGSLLWQQHYIDNYWNACPQSLITTNDNGFLINAYATVQDTSGTGITTDRSVVIKTDSNGIEEWNTPFGLPEGYRTLGGSSIETADSGFITLCTRNLNGYQAYLFKVNKSGNILWHKLAGDTVKCTEGADIAKTSDTTAVIVANTYYCSFFSLGYRLKVIEIDMSGNLLDSVTYGGNDQIWVRSVNSSTGSKPIIGATRQISSSNMDIYILKLRSGLIPDSIINLVLEYDSLCKYPVTTSSYPFDVHTEIDDNLFNSTYDSIAVYPNPADVSVNFKICNRAGESYSLTISDLLGKDVKGCNSVNKGDLKLDISGLQPGIYFYNVQFSDHKCVNGKIIKSK